MEEKIKVLVIDDMPFILKATKILLTKAGFDVETAPDGDSGMEKWKSWKPDCVLLDLMMPGKTGWEVLEEMRSSSDYEPVPVYIYSAKDEPGAEELAAARGAAGFILKPLDSRRIAKMIREAVAKNRSHIQSHT
jgi:CheY-like chemotaxis protein